MTQFYELFISWKILFILVRIDLAGFKFQSCLCKSVEWIFRSVLQQSVGWVFVWEVVFQTPLSALLSDWSMIPTGFSLSHGRSSKFPSRILLITFWLLFNSNFFLWHLKPISLWLSAVQIICRFHCPKQRVAKLQSLGVYFLTSKIEFSPVSVYFWQHSLPLYMCNFYNITVQKNVCLFLAIQGSAQGLHQTLHSGTTLGSAQRYI